MESIIPLQCPKHRIPLLRVADNYECKEGCIYPIVNGIPRFAPISNYTNSFGLQWNYFRKTQLDSYTGLTISQDRLTRCLGGSLDTVAGKLVLEAGCGAGRFTEILLKSGASVFACDLSSAVEACYQNNNDYPNLFICQADILELPVLPEGFEVVICLGVIQHTPDPETTIATLCKYVRPGGLIILDHYTYGYEYTPSRQRLRTFLLKKSPAFSMCFIRIIVGLLWPLHKLAWKTGNSPLATRLRSHFLQFSPVVDYHAAYPQLSPELLYNWAILDTHDTVTDTYKHMRSADEIAAILSQCGMTDITTSYAGNGVEARARRPHYK